MRHEGARSLEQHGVGREQLVLHALADAQLGLALVLNRADDEKERRGEKKTAESDHNGEGRRVGWS